MQRLWSRKKLLRSPLHSGDKACTIRSGLVKCQCFQRHHFCSYLCGVISARIFHSNRKNTNAIHTSYTIIRYRGFSERFNPSIRIFHFVPDSQFSQLLFNRCIEHLNPPFLPFQFILFLFPKHVQRLF